MGFSFHSGNLDVREGLSIQKSTLTHWRWLKYWFKLARFVKIWNFQIEFWQEAKDLTWVFIFRNEVLSVFIHLK